MTATLSRACPTVSGPPCTGEGGPFHRRNWGGRVRTPAECWGVHFCGDAEDQHTLSTGGKTFKGVDRVTASRHSLLLTHSVCAVPRIRTWPARRKLRLHLSQWQQSGRMVPAQLQGAMCTVTRLAWNAVQWGGLRLIYHGIPSPCAQ